jgi:hypothetical protein
MRIWKKRCVEMLSPHDLAAPASPVAGVEARDLLADRKVRAPYVP